MDFLGFGVSRLCRSGLTLKNLFGWRTGDGQDLSFWFPNRMNGSTVEKLWKGSIVDTNRNIRVCDVWSPEHGWNLPCLRSELPDTIEREIINLSMPQMSCNRDRPIFLGSTDGKFLCRSAYRALVPSINHGVIGLGF